MADFLVVMVEIITLFFLAGMFNAAQDTIVHHWDTSIFARIKSEGWRTWFKSHWRDKPSHKIWFLWDAWHCFKSLEKLCYVLIVYFNLGLTIAFISVVALGLGFNLFYEKILINHCRNNS